MIKITFLGAGSTIFAKNVLGDCMCSPVLCASEIALYDIDSERLEESKMILEAINRNINKGRAVISTYLGVSERKNALSDADFVVNAIQVGGYDPATITDFKIPEKYGLSQTIGDTLGIGGIMRGLRTIPVMEEIAADMKMVCPQAWLLNYTNPMGILTGYMQRYTSIKTIGLCHSVQTCTEELLTALGMEEELEGRQEKIAGINHMGWLLEICNKDGKDLYPEILKRAKEKNDVEKHKDMVRFEYIKNLGYYCTESSEHNAEYNSWFIKSKKPELIEQYNIPLNEYLRRCQEQIKKWKEEKDNILANGEVKHTRSKEYASHIMEAMVTGTPYHIGGNVINKGYISNLPEDACVEVPCTVDNQGIHPEKVGVLPLQLGALNMTNINVQLLTIQAAVTKEKRHIYHAAMMDPHTAAELSMEEIKSMCNELVEAHGSYMEMYI